MIWLLSVVIVLNGGDIVINAVHIADSPTYNTEEACNLAGQVAMSTGLEDYKKTNLSAKGYWKCFPLEVEKLNKALKPGEGL